MASFTPHDWTTALGPQLQTKSGLKPTAEALKAEVVGLYFSAHWCPPCRKFTPMLGQFYEKLKASGKSFEIVFVSSDKDDASFSEYYGEQASWLALPFAARATKEALAKKYKVRGIPSFVVLDGATGETITLDGRDGVASDPAGFPWRPKSLDDVLGDLPAFENKAGASVPLSAVPGPLLLYFSAHWCPPCRGFTPQLVKFFARLKAAHADANIAFVSSDRDPNSFGEYFGEMGADWLALPFAEKAAKGALSKAFDVQGIPSLVLLSAADASGSRHLITASGRECVADEIVADFPSSWAPKPFGDLTKTAESKGASVNDAKSLCVLAHGLDGGKQEAAVKALQALAKTERKSETLFFFATSQDGIAGRVAELCGVGPSPKKATLVLLDLPDDGAYYKMELPEVSVAALEVFLEDPGDRLQLEG